MGYLNHWTINNFLYFKATNGVEFKGFLPFNQPQNHLFFFEEKEKWNQTFMTFGVPALYQRWLQNGAMASGQNYNFHQPRFCCKSPGDFPETLSYLLGVVSPAPLVPMVVWGRSTQLFGSQLHPRVFPKGIPLRYPNWSPRSRSCSSLASGGWTPSGRRWFHLQFLGLFFGFPAFGF